MRSLLVGLALSLFLVAGCGPNPHGNDYNQCSGSAVLSISWTLRGQPPSATSCTGVDHLEVDISPLDCNGVSIAPVDCGLTRFRYDGFIEGPAQVSVVALDARGSLLGSGTVDLQLADTPPSTPIPIDIQ